MSKLTPSEVDKRAALSNTTIFAEWQRAEPDDSGMERDLTYWLHQLDGPAAPVFASTSGRVQTPPTVRRELAAPRNGNQAHETAQRVQPANYPELK